jgi:hypothetical protein
VSDDWISKESNSGQASNGKHTRLQIRSIRFLEGGGFGTYGMQQRNGGYLCRGAGRTGSIHRSVRAGVRRWLSMRAKSWPRWAGCWLCAKDQMRKKQKTQVLG